MRSTDDLRRELRGQARESGSWPLPDVRPPGAGSPARRTPWAAVRGTGVVLATAAVVAAVVLVPRLGDDGRAPAPPPAAPPTSVPAPEPTQDWEPVGATCLAVTPDCVAAGRIRADGVELVREGLAQAPTREPDGSVRATYSSERSLDAPEDGTGGRVLVGATGSGAGSRLRYRLDDGPWRRLPSDGPLLVPVPDGASRVRVVVQETARPVPAEDLLVAWYAAAP